MLLLNKGDLIRVPADTCIIQAHSELSIIEKYRFTKKPEIGIFIKYDRSDEAIIYLGSEYCIVRSKHISRLKESVC